MHARKAEQLVARENTISSALNVIMSLLLLAISSSPGIAFAASDMLGLRLRA
jgi:hypothetical protein